MTTPTHKYKLWHIPQVPMPPFEVESDDLQYLVRLQDVLADYDDFQLKHRVKPDYSSISGIDVLDDDGEWEGIDDYELGSLRGMPEAEALSKGEHDG